MSRFLRRLRTDQRGAAAIEFAFVSTFLFGILIVALDFGFYMQQRLRLGAAVEQAAILAYNTHVTTDTSTVSNYVRVYSGVKTQPTVTVTCNGTSSCGDNKCSCITATGTFTIVGSCSSACSASIAVSGNYLKIVATTPYTPVIVPNRYLGGSTITETAVVRLQ